jgi:hypothetical protein
MCHRWHLPASITSNLLTLMYINGFTTITEHVSMLLCQRFLCRRNPDSWKPPKTGVIVYMRLMPSRTTYHHSERHPHSQISRLVSFHCSIG